MARDSLVQEVRSIDDLKPGDTVGALVSGGLDSVVVTQLLTDHGVNVVGFTADLGQPDESDFADIGKRMTRAGCKEWVPLPLQERMAHALLRVLQADARIRGYFNTTAAARYVIIDGVIPEMRKRGIRVLAHGATGKGNDGCRFHIAMAHLADFQVYAPWRDPKLKQYRGRQEMIAFCAEKGIPTRATAAKPYSMDGNEGALTYEGGKLESLLTPVSAIEPGFGVFAKDAPDRAEHITVRFERGVPVEVNGVKVSVLEAIREANRCGGRNGVGIRHVVEPRATLLMSRGIYQQPGMEVLSECYRYLLQQCMGANSWDTYYGYSAKLAREIYEGRWFGAEARRLSAYFNHIAGQITGAITLELYKGNMDYVATLENKHSIYVEGNASMETGVGSFDPEDTSGFLALQGLAARTESMAGLSGTDHIWTPN